MSEDIIIRPSDLRRALKVCAETVRRWQSAGKLPPYDVRLSQKTCGWKRSTLKAAGLDL